MRHLHAVSLKEYCTYRIGGLARDMFFPATIQELRTLILDCRGKGRNFWLHGAGANTLFPDEEVVLPVISTQDMSQTSWEGNAVRAEAGKKMDAWVAEALRRGLGGVECLSGIPGTLGGALFMNAGAYGQEISDFVEEVTVLAPDGLIRTLGKAECGFGYRQARGLRGSAVLFATWRLPEGESSALLEKRREVLDSRRMKQPLEFPSAGSVFKRPEGAFASQLLDQAGLKGARIGGAEISEKHAGFIINKGNATCADVLALVALCQRTVRERFGRELELEQQLCPTGP